MTIAKRVRDFRYAKGWGPDELASRAEISRTALYQIECGKTEAPRAGTLKRIARALDVSIEALLGNDEGAALDLSMHRTSSFEASQPESDRVSRTLDANGYLESRPVPVGLHQKLDDLLSSPMADSIARIVVESHRLICAGRPVERF